MDKEEKRLDRLSELLHALPVDNMPMTLSELDGYVTGVLACPEMIPPSEWLPQVWGETGDAYFANQKAAEETIGAVMTHYNSVAQAMTQSLWIEPLYEVDSNTDEILWEKANIYLKRNNIDKTMSYLDRILENHPEDIYADDALYTKARIYDYTLKNPEMASKLYLDFLTTFPGSLYSVEVRKRLRVLRKEG